MLCQVPEVNLQGSTGGGLVTKECIWECGVVSSAGRGRREKRSQKRLRRVQRARRPAPQFGGLAVRCQEQPAGLPFLPPLGFGEPGVGEVVPLAQQVLPAARHRHGASVQAPFHVSEPRPEDYK